MNRRELLRTLGLTAGLLPLASSLQSCDQTDPGPEVEYDGTVAIIGAGASGLFAADILKSKGVKVRIFEASDRLGGRIKSISIFDDAPVRTDFPVELGAERVLGSESEWATIIKQNNIPTIEITAGSSESYIVGDDYLEHSAVESNEDFVAAKNFLDQLKSYSGDNVSVESLAINRGLSEKSRAIVNSWIGNRFGTSNSRLSASAVAETLSLSMRNASELLLRSNPMQDVLSYRFNAVEPAIEYNTVIKNINYGTSGIVLSGEKIVDNAAQPFSETVQKVIIAVPVSIIKTGMVSFTPALPQEKTNALSNLGMDPCIRMVLDFKQNFWGKSTSFIYGDSLVPEFVNTGFARSQFNKTLSMTVYGSKAEQLSALAEKDAINAVLADLDTIFDGKATANIRRNENDEMIYELFDWTKQPFIQGGISYLKPGGSNNDRVTWGKPINNILFFAGEATDVAGEAGTINGALVAAERAALEVIHSIVG